MRGQLPEIPVVVVSGSEDGSTINKCMDWVPVIHSCAPLDVLSQAVEQVLLGEEWLLKASTPARTLRQRRA